MRRATAILVTTLMATGFVALTSAARAQSAMPEFSDPYGGVSTYVHDDAHGASSGKPLKKLAAKKPSAKMAHHTGAPQNNAQNPASLGAAYDGLAPADEAPRPVALAPSQAKQKDSAVGFDMKWSASSDPIYNPGSSTIPGVDQVKRSVGEPGAETGTGVEAGVNLKF